MIVARYAQEAWGIQYHIYAVLYAALGFAVGLDWLLAYPRRVPGITTALLLSSLTLLSFAYLYQDILRTQESGLVDCARSVKQLVPGNVRIIVSTVSYGVDNGTPNNYEEPTIFFYSHRYGWSLPHEWHTPEKIEQLHQTGAAYFVIYSEELYRSSSELVNYLNDNAKQIGPGVESGCGIFQFKS